MEQLQLQELLSSLNTLLIKQIVVQYIHSRVLFCYLNLNLHLFFFLLYSHSLTYPLTITISSQYSTCHMICMHESRRRVEDLSTHHKPLHSSLFSLLSLLFCLVLFFQWFVHDTRKYEEIKPLLSYKSFVTSRQHIHQGYLKCLGLGVYVVGDVTKLFYMQLSAATHHRRYPHITAIPRPHCYHQHRHRH